MLKISCRKYHFSFICLWMIKSSAVRWCFIIYRYCTTVHRATHSAVRIWWLGFGSRWWTGFGGVRCVAGRCWPGTRRLRRPPAWGERWPARWRRWRQTPCWWTPAACERRPTAAWRNPPGWYRSTTTGSPAPGSRPRRSRAQRRLQWVLSLTWVTSQTQLERRRVESDGKIKKEGFGRGNGKANQ